MISAIHQLQCSTEDEGEEQFQQGLHQSNEQLSVWEDNGEHQEA